MNLYYNLLRYCESKKLNLFDYFPFTICLTLSQNNFMTQIENFKQFCLELPNFTPRSEVKYVEKFSILGSKRTGETQTINIPYTYNSGNNMWIIKPINLNRGRCIQVLNDTDKIVEYLLKIQEEKKLESETNNNIKCEHILLQKYLEKPLLYQGRKFDIRIWVLLSHDMKVYIFKEGHLKATSTLFSLEDKNFFVHLTNYSVQKYCDDFGKEEIGNEISFDEFEKSLKEEYNLEINVRKFIMNKIKKIVEISMKSVKKSININNRKGCFEIFGYDFMFDEELTPFLIEINTNPGLEISSPLISKLIPRMIDDAFRLTIDLCFETIYSSDRYGKDGYISPFHVEGYSDYENMFELIVNLNEK